MPLLNSAWRNAAVSFLPSHINSTIALFQLAELVFMSSPVHRDAVNSTLRKERLSLLRSPRSGPPVQRLTLGSAHLSAAQARPAFCSSYAQRWCLYAGVRMTQQGLGVQLRPKTTETRTQEGIQKKSPLTCGDLEAERGPGRVHPTWRDFNLRNGRSSRCSSRCSSRRSTQPRAQL